MQFLTSTVPAEAYSRQVKCSRPRSDSPDECTGALAVQAEYTPMVVVPTDLANLKPEEWKAAGCVFDPVEYEMTMFPLATPGYICAEWIDPSFGSTPCFSDSTNHWRGQKVGSWRSR